MRMIIPILKRVLLLLLVAPLCAMGQQGLVNGKTEFKEGNYSKAIKLLESAKKAGASEKGIREIEEYLNRAERCKGLRDKADNAYGKGDYVTAKKYYTELLKEGNNPDDPKARSRVEAKGEITQKSSTQSKPQTTTQPKQQITTQPKPQTTTQPKQQTTTQPKQQITTQPKKQATQPKQKETPRSKRQQSVSNTEKNNQHDDSGESQVESNTRLAVESFQKAKQFYYDGNYSLALSQLSECRRRGLWGEEQQKLQRDVSMSRDYALVLKNTSQLTVISDESAAQACRDFVANYPGGPNVAVMKGLLYNYFTSRKDYVNARKYATEAQLRNIDNMGTNRPYTTAKMHDAESTINLGVFGDAMLPFLPECGLTLRVGGLDDYFNFTFSFSHQWMQTDTAQGWNHGVMVENGDLEGGAWYGECNMIRYRQWNVQAGLRFNFTNNRSFSPYIELGGVVSFNTGGKVFVHSYLSNDDLIALTDINAVKLLAGSVQLTAGISWKIVDLYLLARYTAVQPYDREALNKLYLFNITPMIGESVSYEVDGLSAPQILQTAESSFPYGYYNVQNLMMSNSKFAEAIDKRLYWGAGVRVYLF